MVDPASLNRYTFPDCGGCGGESDSLLSESVSVMTATRLSRRQFFRTAAGVGLAGGLASAGLGAAPPRSGSGPARNVIFMVADGMCIGALGLADHYLQLTEGRYSHWRGFYDLPGVRRSLVETASANSPVTDSAAAGSAWGIGERVNNRALNVTPDGRRPEPLGIQAKSAGKKVGLVTTARITHATPASFAANAIHRNQEDSIAEQYLERGINLLMGGGSRHFDPQFRDDGRDLAGDFEQAGYRLVRSRTAANAAAVAEAERVLGLFARGHLPYSLDARNDAELSAGAPTLAEMTGQALANLDRHPEGFLLQVEGGRVDHGGHANDAGALLFDQLAFDEAVARAVAFVGGRDDTLLIVTTDHGTGGVNLNGLGLDYLGVEAALGNLPKLRHTFEYLFERQDRSASAEEFWQAIESGLGLPFTAADQLRIRRSWEGFRSGGIRMGELGRIFGEVVQNHTAVGWTGGNHTGEPVEFAALGPGSEAVTPFSRNFEAHQWVLQSLALPTRS